MSREGAWWLLVQAGAIAAGIALGVWLFRVVST
jgi:hypothetical protein